MTKLGKQKITDLIQEMGHYDPDNMQMAAKRLSQMIISGQINLDADPKNATLVRQAYMKQIQSQNDTVQSQAIKYLADIIPKLPSVQIQHIFQKILDYIINLNTVEKKRQRYGVCAASVIHQAADQYGNRLENLFLKSIVKLLQLKDKKNQIEIILINIITQFIKKWPLVASKLQFARKNLVVYLLKNIQTKAKFDIIKKSQLCIGKLSYILDRQLLNTIIQDQQWGLLSFVTKSFNKKGSIDHLKHLRNGLLTINQTIKTRNIQLRHFIKNIVKIYLNIINSYQGYQQIDNIQLICDILQSCLTGLSSTIKTFHKEMKDTLQQKHSPLYQFVVPLLDFNVQGMMSYAGQPMQVEGEDYQGGQDYYQQAQVDEKCWKVRRSALFYISTLAKYDKTFLNILGENDLIRQLGNKLVQQHNMVSQMAFQTFNQLISIISVDRNTYNSAQLQMQQLSLQRVKSSALSLAENIINQISQKTKIIFVNTKFNDQLKIESSKILLKMIQIYHHILISNQNQTFNLLSFILDQTKRTTVIQNKCNLILCLRELISKDYSFSRYARVHQLLFQQIAKYNNNKLHNVCIITFKRLNQNCINEISQSPYLNKIIQLLKTKIKEFDGDKQVKTSVVKCLKSILANYDINQDDMVYFLDHLLQKIKIQIEKIYILEAIINLKHSNTLSAGKIKVLQNLIRQICQNIGSKNYQLNIKSIDAITTILSILNQKTSTNVVEELLSKSNNYIQQGKIPSFIKIILLIQPKLLKPYAQSIVKCTQSQYIIGLIQQGIIDINNVMKIFKSMQFGEKNRNISQTIGKMKLGQPQIFKQIDQTLWGRIMIGALGYIGDQSTVDKLFQIIDKTTVDQTRFEACSAIGNIASRNQNKYISKLIQRANKSNDVYIYIYIFKEMLNFNESNFSQSGQLINWLLEKCQNKFQAQSNYYITSQCIGKLAFISNQNAGIVMNNSRSNNQNRRLIIANSLRFGLQTKQTQQFAFLDNYIKTTIQLYNDNSVKVRQGAAKSLLYLSQVNLNKLKGYLNQQVIWKSIMHHASIHNQLIITIDYGACKEIKDQGKSLRLQTFNLLQNLVTKSHVQGVLIQQLMRVCLNRINEQTANDIIIKRLLILKQLCKKDYSYFARIQQQFVYMMNFTNGIFKNYKTKIDDERIEIYVKSCLKELLEIVNLTKSQNYDRLNSLMIQIRGNNLFNGLIDSLEKNK